MPEFLLQIITIKIATDKFFRCLKLCFCLLVYTVCQNAFAQNISDGHSSRDVSPEKISAQITQWEGRASRGDREAQFRLGLFYGSQVVGEPDLSQAAYWYGLAAKQGHPIAQYNLGVQFMSGKGVEQSAERALSLWLQAANAGHVHAQFNVGRAYFLGVGLEENHLKARYWFEQAAKQKEPKSIDLLKKLGWIKENTVSKNAPLAKQTKPIAKPQNVKPTPQKTLQNAKVTENSSIVQINKPKKLEKVPESTAVKPSTKPVINKIVALYSAPTVQSKLITNAIEKSKLHVQTKLESGWLKVKSKVGFPVWVHSDFVKITGKEGILIGEQVQARVVPNIVPGSIVGIFQRNENVEFIEQQGEWLRVTAPPRFNAWVQEKDW